MITSTKKVIGSLLKCYSVARIFDDGEPRLLCAAEKKDSCYLFDTDGNRLETLWEGPGGVMTLEQFVPASAESAASLKKEDTVILATCRFYSPNDSADAKIVYYVRSGEGNWERHDLCDLPFVHRFGILKRNGINYLVACTLKSAHAFKDDWTCPGRVWVCALPEDIRRVDTEHPLTLTPLLSGLFRNHGFAKITDEKGPFCLVGSENGIFKVVPPEQEGGEWSTQELLSLSASDMLYEDFDGDGKREMLTISPFHGDTLEIYRDGERVFSYPEKLPFLHAICAGTVRGKRIAFVGNREGKRELLAIYYDAEKKDYAWDVLDAGAGPANVFFFEENGKYKLLAANRETDEIALYEIEMKA